MDIPFLKPVESVRKNNLNHRTISSPEDGNRASFQNVAFFRILDNGQSPKNPVIPNEYSGITVKRKIQTVMRIGLNSSKKKTKPIGYLNKSHLCRPGM
jgi:hypothetical protein